MDSDDVPFAYEANSKSKLIEFQHVGVTAKIQSPMKRVLPECSSAETDTVAELFNNSKYKTNKHNSTAKYNKFTCDDSETTTVTTTPSTETTIEESKLLYEMHAERQRIYAGSHPKQSRTRNAFSRIEFQLYNKPTKRLKSSSKHRGSMAKKRDQFAKKRQNRITTKRPSLIQRLRESLERLCASKAPIVGTSFVESLKKDIRLMGGTSPTKHGRPEQVATKKNVGIRNNGDGLDDPIDMNMSVGIDAGAGAGIGIGENGGLGFYPFEHGCANYLRTTDCPPQILSNVLDDHATYYATRFWAEFFGSLHIAVSFVVTFVLQSYRFILHSLVNTLLVGVLQMTSDYLLKPMLTVVFNGFLQPPLIFVYNILASLHDLLEPIANTLNSFMKPLATVGRSLRFVHVNYNKRKFVKDV